MGPNLALRAALLREVGAVTDGAHDLPMARAIQARRDAIAELARMSRHGASPNAERNPDARARELNGPCYA